MSPFLLLQVGGLPVHELNQLELQFLLLNDFKLVIPLEEMQRYADQLLIYGGSPPATYSDDMIDQPVPSSTRQDRRSQPAEEASPRRQNHNTDVSMRET